MSQDNVETTHRFLDALNRRDYGSSAAELGQNFEVDDTDIPESTGTDSFYLWLQRWDEAWDIWTMEDIEVRGIGDGDTLSLFKMIVRAKKSGIELSRKDAAVFNFQEGKITRIGYYNDQTQALQAVGLSEYAMSQKNVEVIRKLFAAAQRRDVETARSLVADDLEILPLRFAVDGTVFRGPDAIRDFFNAVDESWDDLTLEAEEFRESGDCVLATVRVRARGRTSGASIDTRTGWLATFEDGRVKHWRHYSDPSQALEAVGLAE